MSKLYTSENALKVIAFQIEETIKKWRKNYYIAEADYLEEKLQELVNKATPMKTQKQIGTYWCECPKCNKNFNNNLQDYQYCPYCGQKLYWSDRDE